MVKVNGVPVTQHSWVDHNNNISSDKEEERCVLRRRNGGANSCKSKKSQDDTISSISILSFSTSSKTISPSRSTPPSQFTSRTSPTLDSHLFVRSLQPFSETWRSRILQRRCHRRSSLSWLLYLLLIAFTYFLNDGKSIGIGLVSASELTPNTNSQSIHTEGVFNTFSGALSRTYLIEVDLSFDLSFFRSKASGYVGGNTTFPSGSGKTGYGSGKSPSAGTGASAGDAGAGADAGTGSNYDDEWAESRPAPFGAPLQKNATSVPATAAYGQAVTTPTPTANASLAMASISRRQHSEQTPHPKSRFLLLERLQETLHWSRDRFSSNLDGRKRDQVIQAGTEGNRKEVKQEEDYDGKSFLSGTSVNDESGGRNGNKDSMAVSSTTKNQVKFKIRHEFAVKELFYGLSVTLDMESSPAALEQLSGVKSITPVRFVSQPRPYGDQVSVTEQPTAEQLRQKAGTLGMCGIDKLHNQGIDGRGVKIAVIDTGVDWTHPALGGCFGKGCKISSGYDLVGDAYNGSNDPVPDSDPYSECGPHGTHVTGIIVADDPKLNLRGVAPASELAMYRVFGCQGGSSDDMLMKGLEMAYRDGADVISLSVGSPSGWSDSPTAKMAAKIAGQGRVVSVAAGNDGEVGLFFSSTPASNDLVFSVGSVDNDFFTVYNATVSVVSPSNSSDTSGSGSQIRYLSSTAWKPIKMPVYATSLDTSVEADACQALPEDGPELSSYLVLVKRGGCSMETKFRHIAKAGGRYVLIYNTGVSPMYIEPSAGIERAAMIDFTDGSILISKLSDGYAVTLTFAQDAARGEISNQLTGGTASPFGTYGPTFDMKKTTDFSAPGGHILSSWPMKLGGYSIMSGTSMAAPFVAGASALMIQGERERNGMFSGNTNSSDSSSGGSSGNKNNNGGGGGDCGGKGCDAAQILNRLRSTAIPILNNTRSGLLESVAKQGTGLIQVDRAVLYASRVSPTMMMLEQMSPSAVTRRFRLENSSNSTINYLLSHEPSGTALTFPKKSVYQNRGPVPLSTRHANLTMTPSNVTLAPGDGTDIQVTFEPPTVSDLSVLPVFSGFIRVHSSTEENLSVGYLGIASSLSNYSMLDRGNGMTGFTYNLPAIIVGQTGKAQKLPRAYTFRGDDIPILQFRLIFGSRLVKVELVEVLPTVGTDHVQPPSVPAPVVGRRQLLRLERRQLESTSSSPSTETIKDQVSSSTIPSSSSSIITTNSSSHLLPTERIVGTISSANLIPRNSLDAAYGIYELAWDGTLESSPLSSFTVSNGQYQMLLSVLKISPSSSSPSGFDNLTYSDNSNQDNDFETYISPIITVARPVNTKLL